MKTWKWVLAHTVVLLLLFPAALLADQCDDLFDLADQAFDAAHQAAEQKDYQGSAELYEKSAALFGLVSRKRNCRCPKIHNSALHNAQNARENAKYYRRRVEADEIHSREVQIYEEYNRAKKIYNTGDDYARRRQWDQAIASFDRAAEIWERIGNESEDENGRLALKSAKQARAAARLARQYQR
jgi:tetratricopeptide (TPR) repeat protein